MVAKQGRWTISFTGGAYHITLLQKVGGWLGIVFTSFQKSGVKDKNDKYFYHRGLHCFVKISITFSQLKEY